MTSQEKQEQDSLAWDSELVQQIQGFIRSRPGELVRIPGVRRLMTRHRYSKYRNNIRTLAPQEGTAVDNVLEHNLDYLDRMYSVERPDLLVAPLMALNAVRLRKSSGKVLTLGPRTEYEVFSLMAAGFPPENITAADLITYTPLIELQDMHAMTYEDERFDVVLVGWVLAYSTDQARAAAEIVRITRPGGHISIGCEYRPEQTVPEERDAPVRRDPAIFRHAGDIEDLFREHGLETVFRSDIHPEDRDQPGEIVVVLRRPL